MDKSKEYIDMCKEARRDILAYCKSYDYQNEGKDFVEEENEDIYVDGVWLPRQEDCQRMMPTYDTWRKDFGVMVEETGLNNAVYQSHSIIGSERPGYSLWMWFHYYWKDFKTWEQLWLAVAMYSKFNKLWIYRQWHKQGKDIVFIEKGAWRRK